MNLGEKLKELRKEHGYTQSDLSEKLDVSKSTIARWENENVIPSIKFIKELSKLYDIKLEGLFELILDSKEQEEENYNKTQLRAKNISLCILIYFVSIIWLIASTLEKNLHPILVISIFLTLCGISTSIIIYTNLNYNSSNKKNNNIVNDNMMLWITLVVYLFISYVTEAWYITWIIWIVYVLLCEIKKLVYLLRGSKYEKSR